MGDVVVVAGGMNSNGPVTSIELIDVSGPDPVPIGIVSTMGAGPIDHAAMRLGNDSLALSGGFESEDRTGASSIVEIWTLGPAGIGHRSSPAPFGESITSVEAIELE